MNCSVSASERFGYFDAGRDAVIAMDERGEIRRNLANPPVKDTVVVPTSGLTVVRFLADNPGFWLAHCHMSMHNHIGMAFVIKVTTTMRARYPCSRGGE